MTIKSTTVICAVHGKNIPATQARTLGSTSFCTGYFRENLFEGFDPQPFRPLVDNREPDNVVRLVSNGVRYLVVGRQGDVLTLQPCWPREAPRTTATVAECWPARYVSPSRNTCWE